MHPGGAARLAARFIRGQIVGSIPMRVARGIDVPAKRLRYAPTHTHTVKIRRTTLKTDPQHNMSDYLKVIASLPRDPSSGVCGKRLAKWHDPAVRVMVFLFQKLICLNGTRK